MATAPCRVINHTPFAAPAKRPVLEDATGGVAARGTVWRRFRVGPVMVADAAPAVPRIQLLTPTSAPFARSPAGALRQGSPMDQRLLVMEARLSAGARMSRSTVLGDYRPAEVFRGRLRDLLILGLLLGTGIRLAELGGVIPRRSPWWPTGDSATALMKSTTFSGIP